MTTKRSGLSNPAIITPVTDPVIEIGTIVTAMETVFLLGSRNPEHSIEVNDGTGWTDLTAGFNLRRGKFIYPMIVKTGVNEVKFRSIDIVGNLSGEVTHSVTKYIREQYRFRSYIFSVNGVVYDSKYFSNLDISLNRKDGIMQMSFTIKGSGKPVLDSNDAIKITTNDGLISTIYEAPVITGKNFYDSNGEQNQSVMCQATTDRLPRLTFTGSLRGTKNGEIIEYLARQAGYEQDNIYVPEGNNYVGPRTLDNQKPFETIIKELMFIENWQIYQIDNDNIAFLPTETNRFVQWTFNDDEILSLEDEFDGSFKFNQLRLVYENLEDDDNINYIVEEQIPDKSGDEFEDPTFDFFKSDLYQDRVTTYAPESVLFFAAYGLDTTDTDESGNDYVFDWNNVVKAKVILKFNNTGDEASNNTGGSLLTYPIDMEVFPDKKIAVGFFDLRPNHLLSSVPVYYQWLIVDADGHYLGTPLSTNVLELTGEDAGNFEQLVTAFGVQMTEVLELGTFEQSWYVGDADSGPLQGEQGVFYSRYDKINDNIIYEYFVEMDVDDAVWSTVYFDIENATRNTADDVHMLNAEIIQDDNQLINGNKYINSVKSHEPNSPVKRADKLLFKVKSNIDIGETISIKFTAYGRRFISAADGYEDYRNINIEVIDSDDVASRTVAGLEPTILDGGVILSGFVSSIDQAREKLRRIVYASSQNIVKEKISVQGFSEMREGQLVRIHSVVSGQAYNSYYFITNVSPNGKKNQIDMLRARKIRVSNTTGYTEPYAPDLSFDLTDLIEEISSKLKQFQFGTVQAQKYRGMYRVKLDSGIEVKHCLSRVTPVESGDRVAVAQTSSGSYIILMVIKPSMSEEFEEFLAPDEDEAEKYQDELAVEQSEAVPTSQRIPTTDRPFGDIFTISKITASRKYDNIIPYRNLYFDVTVSHDFLIGAKLKTPSTNNSFSRNIANFLYVYEKNGSTISVTYTKINTNTVRITPKADFGFNKTIVVGIQPVNDKHPGYPSYKGDTIYFTSRTKDATLKTAFSNVFIVQPELEVEIDAVGHNYIDVVYNQKMDTDIAVSTSRYVVEHTEA